jgi:excisionase family DNA binding protein
MRLYTVAEAAETLGTSKAYVYERLRAGELRSVDLGTPAKRKLRIRADDLQAFIDARTTN